MRVGGPVLWLLLARRPKPGDELAGIDPQSSRQLEDVVQRHVAPATLDLPKERPVQVTAGREPLLAQAQLLAPPAHACAELSRCL